MMLKREKAAWRAMRRRCLDPKHKDWPRYGGAGIQICSQWSSFETFIADLGPAPSQEHWLGRLDVKGNYEPNNCLWTTRAPQIRRRAYCHKVRLNVKALTIAEASRALQIEDYKLRRRILQYGRTLPEAASPASLVRGNEQLLTHQGETYPLGKWAKRAGLPVTLLWQRLKAGWPPALALDPQRRRGQRLPAMRLLKPTT